MISIVLFAEDYGHEAFLSPLLLRMAVEHGLQVQVKKLSVRGGHGKAITELRQYVRGIRRDRETMPDLLVVAIDCNCKGYSAQSREIENATAGLECSVVLAIPDPHIERWLLLDSQAFKAVLGRGCDAPDQKCEKDRYKGLLLNAIRDSGVAPVIGGMEHAESLVNQMDLEARRREPGSLARLLNALAGQFHMWAKAQPPGSE